MKTTGLFTIHEFDIQIKELSKPISLFPFGDVHKFAPLHSDDKWGEFLETARTTPNAYFFGMGDYMDVMSATERTAYTHGDYHESTQKTIEKGIRELVKKFNKDIAFMGGRLIGLIEGNHYFHFSSGITSTQEICREMGCKYFGCMTFTRLRFVYKHQSAVMDIWAHHGKGAASFLGGSLKRVEDMARSADADVYLMGHDHKGPIGFTPRMRLSKVGDHIAVVERKQFFGRTGSFLRGYVPDEVSYVADGCMNPANLGGVRIDFIPERRGHDTLKIDMKATI